MVMITMIVVVVMMIVMLVGWVKFLANERVELQFKYSSSSQLVLNAVDSDARAFLTDHSVLLPPLFSSSDLQSQEGTDEMVEGHPTKMVEDGEKNEWEVRQ